MTTTTEPQPRPVKIERRQPVDRPWANIQTWPALAFGVGMVVLAAGLLIAWGTGMVRNEHPTGWALVVSGISIFLMLPYCLFRSDLVDVIRTMETQYNIDLDGDGVVGEPPIMQVTAYELKRGSGNILLGELPFPPELVMEWCKAAVNHQSLSFAAWSGKFALPDGTRGRQRYTAFRDHLSARGFVRDVGGNVGLRVCWNNPDAVAFVQEFATLAAGDGRPLIEAEPVPVELSRRIGAG